MSRLSPRVWLLLAGLWLALVVPAAQAAHVNVIEIDGVINPATADFLARAIDQSESDGALALLVNLDTPGGVLEPTKDMVQSLLNSDVATIVFVSPQGAWAASAGTFITMAAHVAAMAPGTSIGAASPVGGGTSEERDEEGERTDVMGQKVEKFTSAFIESIAAERERNVDWAVKAVREAEAIGADEALELNVVDLVARNRADLFEQLEGREVEVAGESVTLELEGIATRNLEMTTLERMFNFVANPNVAFLLVMAAVLGIMLEINSPGLFIPGAIGLVCLVLAVFAFDMLPFSWLGLVLMLAGGALMIAEIFVTSFGLLFAGGIVLFVAGGAMLFDMPDVSDLTVEFWSVLIPSVAGLAIFAGIAIIAVGRTFLRKQTVGVSELIGMVGRSRTALAPEGKVFLRGEHWNALGDEEIPVDTEVQVTAVEGMRLRVKRAASED